MASELIPREKSPMETWTLLSRCVGETPLEAIGSLEKLLCGLLSSVLLRHDGGGSVSTFMVWGPVGVVGQHGEAEMPCWVRSQCHKQRGSPLPPCVKDVVFGVCPSPQLGYRWTGFGACP